jgi:hypothetical protein
MLSWKLPMKRNEVEGAAAAVCRRRLAPRIVSAVAEPDLDVLRGTRFHAHLERRVAPDQVDRGQ